MKSAREALPLCTKLIEGYVNDHSSPLFARHCGLGDPHE